MNTLNAIRSRRSIRRFKTDEVDPALITKVLEAARLAPSSTNTQPWRFVVVRSAEKRAAICDAAHGQPMFRQAPVVIVALGDRQQFRNWPRQSKELINVGAIDTKVFEAVGKVYADRARMASDDPDRKIASNCMIAIDHLVLAATELGLGTCWVMLMQPEEIARILNLPEHMFPVALIPLGYADEKPPARPRFPLEEIAFDEDLEHGWSVP